MDRLTPVTEKEWEKVNKFNKEVTEEFLEMAHFSPYTLKQYRSALRQFFKWVKDNVDNKPLYELKPKHGLRYQNFLVNRGLSSNAVKFKKSVVSSLCQHLEIHYLDEYPDFRPIFNKGIPQIPHNPRREKDPLTLEEFEQLVNKLEEKQEWQILAYLWLSYESGGRRSEIRQVKKEIYDYEPVNKEGTRYLTNKVRAKGPGKEGKIIKLSFGEKSKKAIQKWLKFRGEDDCEYLFAIKNHDEVKSVSVQTLNYWCNKMSDLIGKRVHPHAIRTARATHLAESHDIKKIQKLLGHLQSSTTEIYIVEDESDFVDDIFE